MDGGIILLIIFFFITIWKLVPQYLRHKEELSRERASQAKSPQDEAEIKRLRDRLENLETLICRLDEERNQQFERWARMSVPPSASVNQQVSQMPTNYMNVAAALDGRYQILGELGRGGMGIVFQAHDKQLNEQVAIKILSPMLGNDPEALERMKREVSAARRITHPNVIRIHDISELNGLHFVSMEFFAGKSLKEMIRQRGPLSLMQSYNIAKQICDGLEAAHLQGVVHRDLKSQNIIINTLDHIKIIDFGLARTAQLEGMTATGLIMGTPEYMAPEQVAGKRVDERADIYALGIILYELFTGKLPFTGDSAIAVGFKQLKDDPPSPCQTNPNVSPAIEAVILKALQKDPIQRYRSVYELRSELEKAVLQPIVLGAGQPGRESEQERIKAAR